MTQKLNQLLAKLDKVKSLSNGKWLACCPAHSDKSPSFTIKLADNDRILLHCFGGCSVNEILDAVDMEMSDLYPESTLYQKGSKPPRFNKYELFDRLITETGIISLSITQLLEGKNLNPIDLNRVLLAVSTIEDIDRECRS